MSRDAFSRGSLVATLLFLFPACNLGFTDDPITTAERNECEDNSDCRDGTCKGGMCRSQSTELGALLLQVTPSTGTPIIAGVGFTSVIEDLNFESASSGNKYEISLGHVSRISGAIRGLEIDEENCVLDDTVREGLKTTDRSLAARLTLTPRTRLLGLASASHTVEVSDEVANSYGLSLPVPPGRYDIYVEPQTTAEGCVRPPYLALDREVLSGDVDLEVNLPQPSALTVRVKYPGESSDLRGWTLEIIERTSGRRLSNLAVLSESVETDGGKEYSAEVAFSAVDGADSNPASELVRLSPPADIVGPEIYVERSVVELFQGGNGLIDQLTELPLPVRFAGRVATTDATVPVAANVSFFATRLQSTGPGTVAAFSRVVATDEGQGLFEVQLLPGDYRVIAEPLDERLAPVETQITVSDAELQAGKTIEILSRYAVDGDVVDFRGAAIGGVSVVMSAADLRPLSSVLDIAQGRQVFPPLATSVASAEDGSFRLLSDQGIFHLSARPQSSTGFPWHIRLNTAVEAGAISVGRLGLPLPVVISGVLTSRDLGGVVPEALIVVHAMLKDGIPVADQADANQVVPVAEARVDERGEFRLLLPSTLGH